MSPVLNECSRCAAGPSAPKHRDRKIEGWHRFTSPILTRAEAHAKAAGVDFDPACHEYRIPNADNSIGMLVPSVTQILKAENLVDFSFCSEQARDRGSRVHEAIWFLCEGDLDRASVSAEDMPYVESAEAFLSDLEVEIIIAEAVVFSSLYGYAGKPDLLCYLRGIRQLAVPDWKTGEPNPATGLQLAGYAGAWQEMTGEMPTKRLAVHLTPGKKSPYKLIDYDDRGDLAVFRGAAAVHNWKRKNNASY